MQSFLAEVNEGLAPENWKITCHLFAHLLINLKLFTFPNLHNYDAFSCLI